jgi:hypothetical protein
MPGVGSWLGMLNGVGFHVPESCAFCYLGFAAGTLGVGCYCLKAHCFCCFEMKEYVFEIVEWGIAAEEKGEEGDFLFFIWGWR